ncbi:MAG TPA: GNAT family N-acetyltransferase [Candidatus Sumerlaeota bacterium]|nr:GNAT family N-acetyltransferase [Candidatus Sumerlaeota bacterium]
MILTRIETPNLLLLACEADAARALVESRILARKVIGYRLMEGWPGAELLERLPGYVSSVERDPSLLGWGVWLVIHERTRLVIGDTGFTSPPEPDGTVRITFNMHEEFRGKGLATEAARALLNWAFSWDGIRAVSARCSMNNEPARRVLEKIGMSPVGSSEDEILWRLGDGPDSSPVLPPSKEQP